MNELQIDPAAAMPSASLVNLIENAAASFEMDHSASRDYLFRAFALIRAQGSPHRQEPKHAQGGLVAWQIKRAITYIDTHLGGRIKGKELAGEVRLSLSHFSRSFRVSVGLPPSQYITRKRVEFAQRRMLTTTDSLCSIAADCGLADQAHLCKVFQRVVGQSPNLWRKTYAGELRSFADAPTGLELRK